MTTDIEAGLVRNKSIQPRALIVTIYGLYARERAGWLAVSTLIRLMDDLGVEEPAVRSAISRLKRRGVLVARARFGTAGYELSATGREMLTDGDQRIFARDRAVLADGWVLAVFSVPEAERQRRHQLRSRLTWLGYGTVAAGVWVAPAGLADETREVLRRHDLGDYVDLFRAEHIGFAALADEVATWWDLAHLSTMYRQFAEEFGPVLASWDGGGLGARTAFAHYVCALTAWRRLPFLDPGLPLEVLPDDWPGVRAAEVFDGLRERLQELAHQHIAQELNARV